MAEPRVACRTPAKGRAGITNIPQWKFDLLQKAILDVLARGPLEFKDLKEAVRTRLTEHELERLGSLGWHVTTVKLELEVREDIVRVPNAKPQQIRLAGSGSGLG